MSRKKVLPGLLFAGSVLLTGGLVSPMAVSAEVNVNINVPLPGFVFPAAPGLVVIPGSYVYYPPDVDIDIFFYQGRWYRPHRGGWYISDEYNGPWRSVTVSRVPRTVIELPPSYRRVPPRHDRIPYRHVRKNWRSWESERHWDDHDHRHKHVGKRERHDHDNDHGHGHGRGRGNGKGKHGD